MDAKTSHERSIVPIWVRIDRDHWVSIRPIDRADATGLSDFYSRLSPESRRRRFLGCGAIPSPAMIDGLAAAPGVVGVLSTSGQRDGAVVAHASIHPDGHGSAEIAFAVADELQGHGLGRILLVDVLMMARMLRLERVAATMLGENGPMRHLLRDAGASVLADHLDAGVEEIVLDPDTPHLLAA
jgi:GNAT superfamily N-acetyltransferase